MSNCNSVSVSIDQPVADVFAALSSLISCIKSGKSPLDIAAAELPLLIKVVQELPQVAADVKSSQQECLNAAFVGAAGLIGVIGSIGN